MTRTEYITTFEAHLRVAEPKRREIISELTTHLDDAGSADPLTTLGKPTTLARKYDATHVGPWASGVWLYLTLIISIFLFLPSRYAIMLAPRAWQDSNWVSILYFLRLLPPFIGSLMTGLALARMKQPGRHITVLIPLAFMSVIVTGLIGYRPDVADRDSEVFVFTYFMSLIQTLFLIGFAAIPFRMERPWWGSRPKRQRI